MRSKNIDLILILLIIGLFLVYFVFINQYFNNDIINEIEKIKINVEQNDWDEARENINTLQEKFNRFKPVLFLNFASEEYVTLYNALDHIEGGMAGEEKSIVLANANIFQHLWNNFLQVVPDP